MSPLALMTLIHLGGDVDLTIVDASEYCTRCFGLYVVAAHAR